MQDDTNAELAAAQAALAKAEADVAAAQATETPPVPLSPVAAALAAYEDSHAQHRKSTVTNANGSVEVDDKVLCECGLCVRAREVLGL